MKKEFTGANLCFVHWNATLELAGPLGEVFSRVILNTVSVVEAEMRQMAVPDDIMRTSSVLSCTSMVVLGMYC